MLVAHLPPDSATWAVLNGVEHGWTLTDFLLADVFHALTGEPHPSRPSTAKAQKASRDSAKVAALLAQRARLAAQKEASS